MTCRTCGLVPAPIPHHERLERVHEIDAALGESIAHLHRSRGYDHALDEGGGFEFSKTLGEESVGEPRHGDDDLAEAFRPLTNSHQDAARPSFSDELDRGLESAAEFVIDVSQGIHLSIVSHLRGVCRRVDARPHFIHA